MISGADESVLNGHTGMVAAYVFIENIWVGMGRDHAKEEKRCPTSSPANHSVKAQLQSEMSPDLIPRGHVTSSF